MSYRRLNAGKKKSRRRAMSMEMVSLLNDSCNTSAIKKLLKQAKETHADSKVKLSASKKLELIRENLRKAVAAGAVPIGDVEQLLLDSEENGRQVILFYKASDSEVKHMLSQPSLVAEKLFGGKNWQDDHNFPLFKEKPRGEVWSDFRLEGDAGWVAKLYRGDDRWVLDRKQSKETERKRVKVWLRKYTRDVLLYRWHAEGLLEIRTPRVDGRKELIEVIGIAWAGLAKLVNQSQFDNYELTTAAAKFAQDESGLDGEIAIGAARVPDSSGGSATYTPRSSSQYLYDSKEFSEAIKHFEKCNEIAVYWLKPSEDDDDQGRIKTIVGYHGHKNCLLIPGRIGSENVCHVTGRLLKIEADERAAKRGGQQA